ncbi:MAG: glutamate--cysteine ligase [Pseudomonadota bacterium]
MSDLLKRRIALLSNPEHIAVLDQNLHGIEREALRVDQQNRLSSLPHPVGLGSALMHPHITTDYAEALLEFVTNAEPDIATALDELDAVHRFAYQHLGDEMLWSQSMPCGLPAEPEIDIARYGSSNIGMLKHVYRRGLALRYGKSMQCIAGIHYNFSLSEKFWQVLQTHEHMPGSARDFQSAGYFALIRNFRRYSWLLMYLFGASPALATDFLRGQPHKLERLSDDTLYLPYATSLRMSDLGYQSNAQSALSIKFDDIDHYIQSLNEGVGTPFPAYEKLGTKDGDDWLQLSTNLLQIENEYYSTIRPKRVIGVGERALGALAARGVQYVEVRCLDVDPFEPIGISLETSRFMNAFLLFCALEDSPTSPDQCRWANDNFSRTVTHGRQPNLTLCKDGVPVELRTWAHALLQQIGASAVLLDDRTNSLEHGNALARQYAKLEDITLTPSARVLEAMQQSDNSFAAFGMRQSRSHAAGFRERPLPQEQQRLFEQMAQESIAAQAALETEQSSSFDAFVENYLGSVG